jgi:hypothetical protein
MELRAIPKKAYQDYFQKWQRHWERCINAGGEYSEGENAYSVAGISEKIISVIFVHQPQTLHPINTTKNSCI